MTLVFNLVRKLTLVNGRTTLRKGNFFLPLYNPFLVQSLVRNIRMGSANKGDDLIFRQLFEKETCTYSYLLVDKESLEAVLIDPVIETAHRDAQLVRDLDLNLVYAMNTHAHADHITGTGMLKRMLLECESVLAEESGGVADRLVKHGEIIKFGSQELEVRSTPGHTNGCVTYVDHRHKMAFTGDALLIRGCGRTDFQEGSAKKLFETVHSQILSLPKEYLLYPAHDYNGMTVTSVEEELKLNPRLTKTKEEFIEIMENLNLPYPKKIDISLPPNKVCGLYELPEEWEKKLQEARPM